MTGSATFFAPHRVALVLQDNFGATLGLIAVLLAVLLLAYYATRYIAKKSGGLSRAAHMRVKERVMLAKDKSVVLLETKETFYLLGVTGQSVQLIAAVGREALGELEEEETGQKQGARGVLEAMGLSGGKKGGFSLFAPRAKTRKETGREDELDALLKQMKLRRSERYGTANRKPEFQEILDESLFDDTKGDA
ncbi:MAG: flagellar biosynthetic protein FliO [Clostridiaceae bacterium]|nr:flagellar biosynthetic protein FliO [Eubacteriales bacterium]